MSTSWWDESAATFAANFALASTGMHKPHEPEVTISHIEMGCYRLSVDKAEIVLTATDLLDVMDWCLQHARELSQQADMASMPPLVAPDETPQEWQIRRPKAL